MPELSVIMTVYNNHSRLEKAVESILKQNFSDLELLLVDDGSSDGCADICDRYAQIDDRVVVHHQTNQGVSAARNWGLEHANGTYIGFVDSDDAIHPQMYEILMKAVKDQCADIAMCRHIIENDYSEDQKVVCEPEQNVLDRDTVFKGLFGDSYEDCQFSVVCNKVYKKSLFQGKRFYGRVAGDHKMNAEVFAQISVFVYIKLGMYHWIQHASSLTHESFGEKNLMRLSAYTDMYHYLKKKAPDVSGYCLYGWFKHAFNVRYSGKGKPFGKEAANAVKKERWTCLNDLWREKKINTNYKIVFTVFSCLPFTYNLYRLAREKRNGA